MPQILLASTSPRRRDLLEQVGVVFDSVAVDIDETPTLLHGQAELAIDYVQRMAYEKSVCAQYHYGHDKIIITADTIGKIATDDGEMILIKPIDFTDAKRMWQAMSANTHEVLTAVCVAYKGKILQSLVSTQVEFITLTDDMMASYWHTGEPCDKAGAYAIQGIGASWVRAIHGSYPNVVGLPIVETLELLEQIQKKSHTLV